MRLNWRDLVKGKGDWPFLRPGIRIKVLWRDEATGESAALLAYDPGARAPSHRHTGDEQIWVLEGEQADETGTYGPGTYLLNTSGTAHEVTSPGGCTVWIHWKKPVEFLETDRGEAPNPS